MKRYSFIVTLDAANPVRAQCPSGDTSITMRLQETGGISPALLKELKSCLNGQPFNYAVSRTLTIIDSDGKTPLGELETLLSSILPQVAHYWKVAPGEFSRAAGKTLEASMWNAVTYWRATENSAKLGDDAFDITA